MPKAKLTVLHSTADTMRTASVRPEISVSREAMPVNAEIRNAEHLPAAVKKEKNMLTYINYCDIIPKV